MAFPAGNINSGAPPNIIQAQTAQASTGTGTVVAAYPGGTHGFFRVNVPTNTGCTVNAYIW